MFEMLSMGTIIVLVVAIIVIGVLYNIYVKVIQKKNKVKEAMGGVDVQLK